MNLRGHRKCLFQFLLWAIPLLCIAVQFYYYKELPQRMAVHFNALGEADVWADRAQYLQTNILLLLGMAALFQLMILSIEKRPPQLLNIPHKAFWLAGNRRKSTVDYIVRYLLWIAVLTLLFLSGLSYQITLVNYYHTFRLGTAFWLMFGVYLTAIVLLTVGLLVHFWRLPKSSFVEDGFSES